MDAPVIENNRLRDHFLKGEAQKRASADPLPGPAGDAFAIHQGIKIGSSGLVVRRVVATDWQILKALDSPILKMLLELRQNPSATVEVPITVEEEWEMAYQFIRPVAEVRATLGEGREQFREMARSQVGDQIDESVVGLIRLAVLEQVRRTFETALAYKQEMEKDGEVTFFQDAGTNPATALAGGSTTLGGS